MEKEKNELQDKTEQILSEVETLAKAEYEVARLKVIDNSSRLVGSLLLTICIILVAFAVLSFFAAAAVFALASTDSLQQVALCRSYRAQTEWTEE